MRSGRGGSEGPEVSISQGGAAANPGLRVRARWRDRARHCAFTIGAVNTEKHLERPWLGADLVAPGNHPAGRLKKTTEG